MTLAEIVETLGLAFLALAAAQEVVSLALYRRAQRMPADPAKPFEALAAAKMAQRSRRIEQGGFWPGILAWSSLAIRRVLDNNPVQLLVLIGSALVFMVMLHKRGAKISGPGSGPGDYAPEPEPDKI